VHGGGYLVLLVAGILIVLADGQLLLRAGAACLSGGGGDAGRVRRMAAFVATIFHLAMLGLVLVVVARWPSVPLAPQALVPKLGLLLLLTAVGHVFTMAVLFRLRVPAPPRRPPPDDVDDSADGADIDEGAGGGGAP
jgi:hypothetical protein